MCEHQKRQQINVGFISTLRSCNTLHFDFYLHQNKHVVNASSD